MASQTLRIAAIGSGPAALYTAQNILKHFSAARKIEIDIYEKLPVPFGLVRYGVAPDHQDVKNVIKTFTDTLKLPNVSFFGNINVGADVKIGELLDAYNCVVLAYGSLSENYLNVPGEKDFPRNFISAKSFVSWYNGLPESEDFQIDLGVRQAMVIGAGNVSIDIARILLSPVEKLSTTDISAKALETIKSGNKIEHVSIVARRGILNAAFTLKELRELTKIDSLRCHIDLKQFEEVLIDQNLAKLARPRKRITEYMYKLAKEFGQKKPAGAQVTKTLEFSFMRSPVEILGNRETKLATGARFELNRYDVDFAEPSLALGDERALNALKVVPVKDAPSETKSAELIVRSIGYKNVNIDSEIPFDKASGVVPNEQGKVIGKDGLYCTGWIKRGPRGVIVDTTTDAYETAQKLCSTVSSSSAESGDKPGARQIAELLRKRNVSYVDKKGWLRIDEEEVRRGKLVGKPREKLRSIEEMLRVAQST